MLSISFYVDDKDSVTAVYTLSNQRGCVFHCCLSKQSKHSKCQTHQLNSWYQL